MLSPVVTALLEVLSGRDAPSADAVLDAGGWEALLREAVRHGVAPLVYTSLARPGSQWQAPPDVLKALKASHLRTGLENLRLLAHVSALLRQLHADGIDVMVLKGAYLAHAVYRDPALRSMGDADLLVRRADLERAAELARACGWRASTDLSAYGDGYHELSSFALDGAQVELHRAIEDDDSPFAIDGDALWQRAVRVEIGGAPALALSAEDLVLHLCLHTAYGHGWLQFDSGLRPLCDIALSLRHFDGRFEWDAFTERAQSWRAAHCMWLALLLAHELTGASVPACVLDRLATKPAEPRWVETATALTLGRHYHDLVDQLPVLSRVWRSKRWRRLPRGARVRSHLLPAPDTLERAYPSLRAAPPVRYAAHWADLTRDMVRVSFMPPARSLLRLERRRIALLRWLERSAG